MLWAARCDTWLLIELTLQNVGYLLFFSAGHASLVWDDHSGNDCGDDVACWYIKGPQDET